MATLVVCSEGGPRAAQVLNAAQNVTRQVEWGAIPGESEYDQVVAAAEASVAVDWASLKAALKPGGKLELLCDQDDPQGNGAGLAAMVAGFKDVAAEEVDEVAVRVKACKPNYATGAKAAISLAAPNPFAAGADDEEMVDEDSLLTEEEINAKIDLPACGPKSKGRRACKNCSCGFAEQLEEEKKQGKELKAGDKPLHKSACGSCYKGDAFRCADCPYRGMPAFEPGQKVELNMEDDL